MAEVKKQRALVVASQTRGLRGCDRDADLMAAVLGEFGFDVCPIRGRAATRAGILGAYADLIQATGPGDAVVVYYAGHGSTVRSDHKGQSVEVRCILPTDIDETNSEDFRGILADELSILQWRLTLRTANVTSIFDCCHSARMSRAVDSRLSQVRACDAPWPLAGATRRRTAAAREFSRLRADHPDADWFDANPNAVRLVACGPRQQAYESMASSGDWNGLFTAALVPALRERADATGRALAELVRYRVLAEQPFQRPQAQGPVDRGVFTLDARPPGRALPIRYEARSGRAWIDGAQLHDIRVGDTYLLVGPGRTASSAVGRRVRVEQVMGGRATLTAVDGQDIPPGSTVYDDGDAVRNLPVVVDGPRAGAVRAGLSVIPGIDIVTAGSGTAIAAVTVTDAGCLLRDAMGRPLYIAPRPLGRGEVDQLAGHLQGLGLAARLQELDFDDLGETVSLEVSSHGRGPVDGGVLHAGDDVWIAVRRDGRRPGFVYANVLDIGIAGRITTLNESEPSGVELAPGERHLIGAAPGGLVQAMSLFWPRDVPVSWPRHESLMAVFSDSPHDFGGLNHEGLVHRGDRTRSPLRDVERLVRRATREIVAAPVREHPARFAIRRVTFLLCPGGQACSRH